MPKTYVTPYQRYAEIYRHAESGSHAAVLCSVHASHNYRVGLGETFSEALSNLSDTPIQCAAPNGPGDALDWALSEDDPNASDFEHIGVWNDATQAPE